jgi:hypothetical protein
VALLGVIAFLNLSVDFLWTCEHPWKTRTNQFIAIRSGIEPGDTVIVDGHYTLAHDARIRVRK